MPDDFKAGMVDKMSDVFPSAGEKVIKADDLVTALNQPVTEMTAEKPGATSDKNRMLHGEFDLQTVQDENRQLQRRSAVVESKADGHATPVVRPTRDVFTPENR